MDLIIKGLQNTWQLKKLIAILWAINLIVASLFLIPYSGTFRDFFSNRMVTDILAEQNIYTYYAEFYHFMGSAVSSSFSWIQAGNLIHYLLIMFLTGGFISALGMKSKLDLKKYWRACLDFGPIMILFGLITPVLLGILFLVGLFAGLPLTFLLPDYLSEVYYFYFFIFLSVLILIFLIGGWLILDLAKIKIIETRDRRVGRALIEAFRLLVRYPLNYFGHYLMIVLLWVIVTAAYWSLQHYLPDRSPGAILLDFFLIQLAVWVQIWIRFSRYDVLLQLLRDTECESD